jgi:hypothetical protein
LHARHRLAHRSPPAAKRASSVRSLPPRVAVAVFSQPSAFARRCSTGVKSQPSG